MILNYPVITSGEFGHEESFRNLLGDRYEELKDQMSLEFQVTEDTPKTFIWHTFEDQTVLLDNTLLFVQALYSELAGKWLNREFPWWGGAKIDR